MYEVINEVTGEDEPSNWDSYERSLSVRQTAVHSSVMIQEKEQERLRVASEVVDNADGYTFVNQNPALARINETQGLEDSTDVAANQHLNMTTDSIEFMQQQNHHSDTCSDVKVPTAGEYQMFNPIVAQ